MILAKLIRAQLSCGHWIRAPLRPLVVVGLGVLTTACSVFPKNEPVAAYRLPPLPISTQNSGTKGGIAATGIDARTVRIVTPNSSRVVDSDRILVLPETNLIQFYANARWTDPAPVLLRNRLVQAFLADGRIRYVSSDDSNLSADQELTGDLISFQSEYRNNKPIVVIKFHASLIDQIGRRVIAMHSFEVQQQVADEQLPEVIEAFGQASDVLAAQLMEWVLAQPGTSTIKRETK